LGRGQQRHAGPARGQLHAVSLHVGEIGLTPRAACGVTPQGGRQQRPGGAGSALALSAHRFILQDVSLIATIRRALDSDVGYSFRTSPTAIIAAVIALVCVFCALFANWVAPHNPFDLATLDLMNARLPPVWQEGGNPDFVLGTDDQGRDILSALM